MGRVVLVDGEAVPDQDVGQALDPLAGQAQPAGDLGHGRGRVLDDFEPQPAGQRLPGRGGQRRPGRGDEPVEPDDLEDEVGEGVPGGRAGLGTGLDTIVHWSEFDRGGHFAVMETPDLLVGDLRAFFGELR